MPSTLDEFAERVPPSRTGFPSYLDALPPEVKQQILGSSAGHSVVVKWLRDELGYEQATQQMVGNWRRKHGWKP